MELTDNQKAILVTMVKESQYTGYSPDEVLWPHRTFERVNDMDYKTISKEMKGLRDNNLVYYMKGGLNEEGEVCGAGNGLLPEGLELAITFLSDEDKLELGYE